MQYSIEIKKSIKVPNTCDKRGLTKKTEKIKKIKPAGEVDVNGGSRREWWFKNVSIF